MMNSVASANSRHTAHGNRRSHPTSSYRNPWRCRKSSSTAETSIGWRDGRRSKAAASSCGAACRRSGRPTSRPLPSTCAPGCMNMAAARGPWRMGRSTFPTFRMAGCIGSRTPRPSRIPLTPATPGAPGTWRFADGVVDRSRKRWFGVREDHSGPAAPVNAIVAVDLAGSGSEPGRVVADGHDFVSSPRLSPDGRRLVWLGWDHPNMPWNGTILYLADLDEDGAVSGEPLAIAGGPAESIFQPEWSPDGPCVVFVSDRSGWWNLHRFELSTRASSAIAPMAAEFGQPQWAFGMSTYASPGRTASSARARRQGSAN